MLYFTSYSKFYIIACFLLLSSPTLAIALRCWSGVDSNLVTKYTTVGQICLSYYNCKNGWVNGQCSTTPTWNYGSYDANTWSNVFVNKFNLNVTACSSDNCNAPATSIVRCYTGYDTPPQMATLNTNNYCYAYKQKCVTVGGPCSNVDVAYSVSKIWYGTNNTCPGVTGVQCCSTDLCNNLGLSSKAALPDFMLSAFWIGMFMVMLFFY